MSSKAKKSSKSGKSKSQSSKKLQRPQSFIIQVALDPQSKQYNLVYAGIEQSQGNYFWDLMLVK